MPSKNQNTLDFDESGMQFTHELDGRYLLSTIKTDEEGDRKPTGLDAFSFRNN